MNYSGLAKEILNGVGGKNNVKRLVNCATRLRFTLADNTLSDIKFIEKLPGVMGVVESNQQFQIIVGGDKVNELNKIIQNKLPHSNRELDKTSGNNTDDKSIKNMALGALNALSEILTPIVPALAASGMLKVILLLVLQFNIMSETSTTYQILDAMSDVVFYFMPLITAYLSAEYFETDRVLAVVFSGILLHPIFVDLLAQGQSVKFVGIPVTEGQYNGTIIPSILMVLLMSKIEPFIEKISPSMIKIFFKPLLMLLILGPATILLIGPLGNWLGQGFGSMTTTLYDQFGWLAVGILGALLPFSVLTGLNRALTPISIQIYTELGHEPLFRTAYIAGNMTIGAAALAVAVRTKNKSFKQIAFSSSITTLLSGISEPSLFGVLVKVKRPLIATTIAGFIGGAYTGIFGVTAHAMAVPGIISIPMFMGGGSLNLIHALIGYTISIIGAFVLTLILGFDDISEKETKLYESN